MQAGLVDAAFTRPARPSEAVDDVVALGGQQRVEQAPDAGVVLDDEDAGGGHSVIPARRWAARSWRDPSGVEHARQGLDERVELRVGDDQRGREPDRRRAPAR